MVTGWWRSRIRTRRERRHDSAVAEVAARFRGADMPVAAGWRWVVSWPDGQLVPDLWVRVPVPGREAGIWVAVEVEFSAKSKKRILNRKLRSYRLAEVRLKKSFPILVITGETVAAKRFDDLAGDLVIFTTTLKEFVKGVWDGPESVWRLNGRPVALSELAEEYRAHLWQRTGLVLDHSKPSPEVWEGLCSEEFICSAPWSGGIGQEVPPISPQLQAAMDRLRNEGQAGHSTSEQVSDAISPTPSPATVRRGVTAQDRVLHEAATAPAPAPARTPATAEDVARHRWSMLRKIDPMIAEADWAARRRLLRTDLDDAERLCLERVRAIIAYGAAQQLDADTDSIEKVLQQCLELEDQHKLTVRSGNPIWRITTAEAKTNPRIAFKDLSKEHRKIDRDVCKTFNRWAMVVDRAVRDARKARTLE